MTIVITNQSKNNFTITNQGKSSNDMTWDQATFTWDDAKGTWDSPRIQLTKVSKNIITIINQTKS